MGLGRVWLVILSMALVTSACGSDHERTADGGADAAVRDSGRVDAGVRDAGVRDAGAMPGPCPTTAPGNGSDCSTDALECEYGDDPRVRCRVTATCESGSWAVLTPTCDPSPTASCPDTREEAVGSECTPEDAYCDYDGLVCHCTNCDFYPVVRCEGPITWRCDAPNPDAQCPPGRPRLGQTCGLSDGSQCEYGCEGGQSRTCQSGLWIASSAPGGCPISTRRAKRDIEYLSPGDTRRLAAEVLGTRLATYEYTDPALEGQRRLGFILEDQPRGSFAGDPSVSQVDLYGYTSLLLAAVQEQQRQIAELKREVRALRRGPRR